MTEIVNPQEDTYWIITNGSTYGTGVTAVGQTTTVGNGWSLWWQGTVRAEYESKCDEVLIQPIPLSPLPD